MKMTLAAIQSAMGAVGFLGDSADVIPAGIQTDSRLLRPGELFICIAGENFDGHTFAKEAMQKGAVAIVAERPPFSMEEMGEMACEEGGVPLLMVQDTVAGLGRLAAHYRSQTRATVVGITGTAGKTTVKEVLAQVLSVRGKTAKNHLNLNNQLGLPLSILAADGDEKFWVMEAGISEPQDMDELGQILRPDLGVVINVGQGHTEGLGKKGVAHYKAKLMSYIAEGGIGLVSADYADLVREARNNIRELCFFSTRCESVDPQQNDVEVCTVDADGTCAYRAEYLGNTETSQGRYRVFLDGKEFEVLAPFCGAYAAENVIAIAAAADLLGLKSPDIIEGFAKARLPEKRSNLRQCDGWQIIDDCYNSNPLSAHRMVETAAEVHTEGPLVFVMGEMLELGEKAHDAHVALGRAMGVTAPFAVFWVGGQHDAVASGLKESGWQGIFEHIETPRTFAGRIAHLLAESGKGTVLFKGSRGNRMERFVEVFADAQEANDAV